MKTDFVYTTVAIPRQWISYCDKLLRAMGYTSRSQYLRELLLAELLNDARYRLEEGKISKPELEKQLKELTGIGKD